MSEGTDPNLPIIVAVVSGLFALLGGFVGAWLARHTEYEKWLRQQRSEAFAAYLGKLQVVREKMSEALLNPNMDVSERDLAITELFAGLEGQERVVRLYLKPKDRNKFSELSHELWEVHGSKVDQSYRLKRTKELLAKLQRTFEETIHG